MQAGSIKKLVQKIMGNPINVRFDDLCKICDHYFGDARQKGSHFIYKTSWVGDPRVNIQNDEGKAKVYQVKQVLRAIERLEAERGIRK